MGKAVDAIHIDTHNKHIRRTELKRRGLINKIELSKGDIHG